MLFRSANRFDSADVIFIKRVLQTALPEKIRSALHELRISADYVSFSDNFWNLFGIRNKPSPSRTKTFFRYILHSLFADKIEEDIGAVIFGLNLVTDADTSLYSRRDYYLKNSFYLNDKMGNDYCPYSWSSDDRKESAILMLRQDENSVSEAVYQYIIDTLLSNKNEIERSPEALTAEINLLCDMADRQFANVALSNIYYDEKRYGTGLGFSMKADRKSVV